MCGIAAILLCPQERDEDQWQAIREAFTRNLTFNEERGKEATGVAVVDRDGRVRLHKATLAASEFAHTARYQEILNSIGAETALMLGHTRLPTKGDPRRNRNNHPIQAGAVFGVHNGEVTNDDELFACCGYERSAEVDSEIIFRMIESVDASATEEHYLDKVRQRIQILEGQYTFLACDQRRPQQLLVLRHGNPLCIHFHPKWNALVFSSRYVFLRRAFGSSVIADPLEHDQVMLFDATKLTQLGSKPRCSIPLYT